MNTGKEKAEREREGKKEQETGEPKWELKQQRPPKSIPKMKGASKHTQQAHTLTNTHTLQHTNRHTHQAHIQFNTHITREDNACKQMANGGRQKAYRLNC